MRRWSHTVAIVIGVALTAVLAVTTWVAFPYNAEEPLVPPLKRVTEEELSTRVVSPYGADLAPLIAAFQPQPHRSFCGPATLATVLRADGHATATEWELFDSTTGGLRTFFGGISLTELARLARANGLRSEVIHGDEFTVDSFRERLKQNLAQTGDYVIINYDRRVLHQAGAGHISAIGSYDPDHDAFLILDQAAYRYPWTWVPTQQLYDATRTLADSKYRGVLFVHGDHSAQRSH